MVDLGGWRWLRGVRAKRGRVLHTGVEKGFFAIVGCPEILPLVEGILGGGAVGNVWIFRIRHDGRCRLALCLL